MERFIMLADKGFEYKRTGPYVQGWRDYCQTRRNAIVCTIQREPYSKTQKEYVFDDRKRFYRECREKGRLYLDAKAEGLVGRGKKLTPEMKESKSWIEAMEWVKRKTKDNPIEEERE